MLLHSPPGGLFSDTIGPRGSSPSLDGKPPKQPLAFPSKPAHPLAGFVFLVSEIDVN
jgi:hypothetical protein